MPFWQCTEGVRANNKRAVLVVYSKESPCLLRCTIALPKKSSVEPDAPTTVQSYEMLFLLWQAIRRGAGGERKAPCLYRCTSTSPKGNPRWGSDAPTTARLVGCRPEGGSTFFRSERKYQRKHAARRLQRRPTSLCTATKPCAALGLGYALHGFQPFLALVGLRPPWAVGFGLREPNGWMPRIYSGHPIPALRPEQSDHVPWADCPQGLSSTSARCAHPPGKSP